MDQFAPLSEQIDKELKSKGESDLVVGESACTLCVCLSAGYYNNHKGNL